MKVAAIVQARVGSSRLPGKVLLDLGGAPVVHHVLERCQKIPGVDAVVCAVPDELASEPLEKIALRCGAIVYRGSESDVLARYLGAARATDADVILRVTSDCPLIDPEICGEVVSLREKSGAEYATNDKPPSFPHGLECEAFTISALTTAADEASAPEDREHVTPWLRRNSVTWVNYSSGNPSLAAHRWTLDYPEDLTFLRAIADGMPDIGNARMRDILRFLDGRPDLLVLNAARRRT